MKCVFIKVIFNAAQHFCVFCYIGENLNIYIRKLFVADHKINSP